MIRYVLLVFLAFGQTALGQTARVISGEHEGFTRLVIELPGPSGWTLGRTAMGYGFAANVTTGPDYDLGRVWDLIPRTRLQSLRVDPDNGALQLALACDCHVFPFEYRPGVVVLDIKDGPPPAGSAFEQPFQPEAVSEVSAVPAAPTEAGYDWLADLPDAAGRTATGMDLPELATGSVSLQPLRDQLLAQISRGAAQGIVEMEMPGKAPELADPGLTDLPWSQIHIGELPGVEATPGGGSTEPQVLVECAPDAMLDLPAWGAGQSPLDLLSASRSGFYGEFDEIQVETAVAAVRHHLYLGFGAEARQYADMVPPAEAPELAYYRSMSRLIDGESDPQTPFAEMLPCDGPAALWAALARERLPKGPEVNVDAILRSFMALPAHLRHSLGVPLAERLLARGDDGAARLIRDAMQRAPYSDPADIAMLDAKADLNADRPDAAQQHAEAAVAEAGAEIAPLVTLVETHARRGEPMMPEAAASLEAVLGESEGRSDEAAIRRALILALALSGQPDEAFAAAGPSPPVELWRLASQLAPDDAFLAHAVLTPGASPPEVPADLRLQIGRRLLDLGFADSALQWLGAILDGAPAEHRLLAAEAELARGEAQAALAQLDDLDQPEADGLRAQALLALGAYRSAHEAILATGDTDRAARVLAWGKDWEGLSVDGTEPWRAAAELVAAPPAAPGPGLLAEGNRLAEDGANARAAIAALLANVPVPAGP